MFATGDLKSNMKKKVAQQEEDFEIEFLQWLSKTEKNVVLLCLEIGLNVSFVSAVEDIGLKLLISVYCTRGANFGARAFKEELREMELPMLVCSKIYMGLEDWRRQFESQKADDISVATARTSSSSSASSVSSLGMFSPTNQE